MYIIHFPPPSPPGGAPRRGGKYGNTSSRKKIWWGKQGLFHDFYSRKKQISKLLQLTTKQSTFFKVRLSWFLEQFGSLKAWLGESVGFALKKGPPALLTASLSGKTRVEMKRSNSARLCRASRLATKASFCTKNHSFSSRMTLLFGKDIFSSLFAMILDS